MNGIPVPPPAPFAHEQTGPWDDGTPMGDMDPYPQNNHHRSPQQGHFGDHGGFFNTGYARDSDSDDNGHRNGNNNRNNSGKDKKDKNNKTSKKRGPPVDIHYEGFILEKLDPDPGEKSTWARVGKRSMHLGEKRLQDIVKAHRQKTGKTPQRDLLLLSSNQQGIINRLLAQQQRSEKHKQAEWILANVEPVYKGVWSKEVKKLQVILKRQERFQIKDQSKLSRSESKSYDQFDIIDLEEPLKPKKDKNKNNNNSGHNVRRTQSFEDLDYVDDRHGGHGGHGLGIGNMPPPPPPPPHGHGGQGFQQMHHNDFGNMPPPPPPQHFEPNGPFPPPPGGFARHPSMQGQPFQNPHPFQPHPEIAVPGQFESHSLDDDSQYSPRDRHRSLSQPRRSSMRRKSVGAREFDELRDSIHTLTSTIQNMQVSDGSSQDSYENDSMWSRNGRDFSEASAPTRYSRGSLPRNKSRNRPRYRSHRYSDAEYEPNYSHGGERRFSTSSRPRPGRPNVLHRAETYDDYPMGRGAEPRYAPRPQRRLTNYEYDEDYDYDRRRDSRYDRDYFQEGYEPTGRDFDRGSRRMSRRQSMGGGGGRDYYR